MITSRHEFQPQEVSSEHDGYTSMAQDQKILQILINYKNMLRYVPHLVYLRASSLFGQPNKGEYCVQRHYYPVLNIPIPDNFYFC